MGIMMISKGTYVFKRVGRNRSKLSDEFRVFTALIERIKRVS